MVEVGSATDLLGKVWAEIFMDMPKIEPEKGTRKKVNKILILFRIV